MISALSEYHQYENGQCGLTEPPIGLRKLAEQAEVSRARTTDFFNDNFNGGQKGGHKAYKRQCADGVIAKALELLNEEVTPSILNRRLKYEPVIEDEPVED